MDRLGARVTFDRLSAQPRSTLAIVTADHGEGLGDHGELTHGVFAYESVLKVPLIVGEIGSGSRAAARTGVTVEGPVRHVDLCRRCWRQRAPQRTPRCQGRHFAEQSRDTPSTDLVDFEAMTPTLTRGWAPLRGVLVGREN